MYNREQYLNYLKSEEWRKKATRRAEIDGFVCRMCLCKGTSGNPLQCHHITYHNLYHENEWKDLITLCKFCHKSVHFMMNRKTSPNKYGWKDEMPLGNHVLQLGDKKVGVEMNDKQN